MPRYVAVQVAQSRKAQDTRTISAAKHTLYKVRRLGASTKVPTSYVASYGCNILLQHPSPVFTSAIFRPQFSKVVRMTQPHLYSTYSRSRGCPPMSGTGHCQVSRRPCPSERHTDQPQLGIGLVPCSSRSQARWTLLPRPLLARSRRAQAEDSLRRSWLEISIRKCYFPGSHLGELRFLQMTGYFPALEYTLSFATTTTLSIYGTNGDTGHVSLRASVCTSPTGQQTGRQTGRRSAISCRHRLAEIWVTGG